MLNKESLIEIMRELGKNGVKEIIVAHDRVEMRTYERGVAPASGTDVMLPTAVASGEQIAGGEPAGIEVPGGTEVQGELLEIKAPLPGTLFVAPGKDRNGNPLPAEGDVVEEGTVIALVEAMKMFNEIFAPVRGVVKRFAAKNEAKVKVGDLIMVIEK